MKKISFIFISLSILICSSIVYIEINVSQKGCSKDKAIEIAQKYINDNEKNAFKETILNYDNPKIEQVFIEKKKLKMGKRII